jgi:hypothetical protein
MKDLRRVYRSGWAQWNSTLATRRSRIRARQRMSSWPGKRCLAYRWANGWSGSFPLHRTMGIVCFPQRHNPNGPVGILGSNVLGHCLKGCEGKGNRVSNVSPFESGVVSEINSIRCILGDGLGVPRCHVPPAIMSPTLLVLGQLLATRFMSMEDGGEKVDLKTCLLTIISGVSPIGWRSPCCVCEQAGSCVRGWKVSKKGENQGGTQVEEFGKVRNCGRNFTDEMQGGIGEGGKLRRLSTAGAEHMANPRLSLSGIVWGKCSLLPVRVFAVNPGLRRVGS